MARHAGKLGHAKIYHSWWHITVTLLFLAVPFIFLMGFAEFAKISKAELLYDVGISVVRLFIAYVVAAAFGWLFAVSFYRGRRAAIALPVFDVLQSFPTYAALPLAVVAWGASNFTVIVFLVLAIIWPIFFSVISSLRLIRNDWEEAVEIYDLRGMAYVKNFLLPACIPGLITGSIVGLGDGWEALVATEIIVQVKRGLGGFFQSFADNPTMTALGIFGLLLVIFSINKLVWLPLLEWSHRNMTD